MIRTGFAAILVALFGVAVAPGVAWGQTITEQQWHLDELRVRPVHDVVRGDGVVVAVVDSGVDDTVPDLAGALLPGTGFGSASGTDGTEDADGHGTAMAALIAGRGVDGGALGIAPAARVLPVSVGSDGGNFTTTAVASGITWAVDNGADVINLSLTSAATLTPDLLRAVNYAFDHDVVVVAGTGNDGIEHVGAPANIRGVIAVSGTEPGGVPWASSNTGPETVLAAPAKEIVTALPSSVADTGFAAVDGTSAATALVSGVAALVRARHPEMDAGNVVNRMIVTATDVVGAGRDAATGFGVVNAGGAVSGEVPRVERNPLAPPPRPSGGVAPPGSGEVSPEVSPGVPREGAGGVVPGPVVGPGVRVAVAFGGLVAVVGFVVGAALLLGRRSRVVAPRVEARGGVPVEPGVERRVGEVPPASDDFWKSD
ncbi:type VII secretion-associated serine protease mycosin [Saccharothrix tamanrassetensis]|uniref:Type VII secretion-associated serine protease mycosin n=1 Tax=Saccharothrix tamanrassetensis TaxID=1051531 RepID=A0A841CW97_9PSEU|nr:S8 family serine peptidase [Saccharothrix tamanrassetensis]MBB5960574.1 type VII secretion-associated serine protease mycosin [Saccharothrix tamanrassetensis]